MKNPTPCSFFWHHIKPYKGAYLLMLLAPITSGFYPLAYNYAVKQMIDILTAQTDIAYKQFVMPILLFVVTQLIYDGIWRISYFVQWKVEPHVRRSILLQATTYVLHHGYAFFQRQFTGSITTKVRGLLDGYDDFWLDVHSNLGEKSCKIIVCLGSLICFHAYIGCFMLVWMIGFVGVFYYTTRRLDALACVETNSGHMLLGRLADSVTNIFTVFSFAGHGREVRGIKHHIDTDFMPKQGAFYRYNFKMQLIGSFFYLAMFSFILGMLLHLRAQHLITTGDFAFVLGLVLVLTEDIWSVTIDIQDFARVLGDWRSALEILKVPQKVLQPPAFTDLALVNPTIDFEGIRFVHHDGVVLFDNLNLRIASGEKIGLVGASGAGKSTLVHLLLGFFPLERGRICIDGQNIATTDRFSIGKHIALIPQETLLFHRSLLENIRYGRPSATKQEIIMACQRAYVHDDIMRLPQGYDTLVGERGTKLSGGQRQRIAIARAILKDSPILILDEATAALDGHTERLVQKSLSWLVQQKRTTVIAIAHRLTTLKHMDRIVVLEQGKIVEEGAHSQLLEKTESNYRRLWDYQMLT